MTDPETAGATTPVHDLEEWGTALSGSFLECEVDAIGSEPFRADISEHRLGDTNLVAMTATAHRCVRESRHIDPAPPHYLLGIQLSGRCSITQDGRTARIGPGDIAFFDSSRPVELSTIGARDEGQGLCFRFPAGGPGDHRRADALTATTLSGAQSLAPALAGLLTGLFRRMQAGGPAPHPHTLATWARHATELTRSLFDDELARRGLIDRDAPREAMRAAVDGYIDRHLADPRLSPHTIAAGLFISPRHLYSLLAEDGRTVAATIRSRRVSRCLDDLADPRQATTPVSAIAVRWGLLDASHFSRLVKEATGLSPVAYRRRTLRDPDARTPTDTTAPVGSTTSDGATNA